MSRENQGSNVSKLSCALNPWNAACVAETRRDWQPAMKHRYVFVLFQKELLSHRSIIGASAVSAKFGSNGYATVFNRFDLILLSAARTEIQSVLDAVTILIGVYAVLALLARDMKRGQSEQEDKKLLHKNTSEIRVGQMMILYGSGMILFFRVTNSWLHVPED
jgi:hypothetical protein